MSMRTRRAPAESGTARIPSAILGLQPAGAAGSFGLSQGAALPIRGSGPVAAKWSHRGAEWR